MAILYRQVYTIDPVKTNYNNAIARFNKSIIISNIAGTEVEHQLGQPYKYYGRDLMQVIADRPGQIFDISCGAGNSVSSDGVLPQLPRLDLLIQTEICTDDELTIARSACDQIAGYVNDISESNGCERGCPLPPELGLPLNSAQAYHILERLDKQLNLSGAMNFPEIDLILFQHAKTNYVLKYGKKPSLCVGILRFDLDDGFTYASDGKYMRPITEKLQSFFRTWKQNDYVGDVLPDNTHNFGLTLEANKRLIQNQRDQVSIRQLSRLSINSHRQGSEDDNIIATLSSETAKKRRYCAIL